MNLSNNSIGGHYNDDSNIIATHEGPSAIANALKVNVSLTSLNLSCNGIGGEGAKSFAEALRGNASLTSLNLLRNCIGDEEEERLRNAVSAKSGNAVSAKFDLKL